VDPLNFSLSINIEMLVSHLVEQEPILGERCRNVLQQIMHKLQRKLAEEAAHRNYELFKVIRRDALSLTNCAFNQSSDHICKVFDNVFSEEVHTLKGHTSVVYAVAFNNKATGCFDRTYEILDTSTGHLYYTLRRHGNEIVCISFDPQSTIIPSGSMDATTKL